MREQRALPRRTAMERRPCRCGDRPGGSQPPVCQGTAFPLRRNVEIIHYRADGRKGEIKNKTAPGASFMESPSRLWWRNHIKCARGERLNGVVGDVAYRALARALHFICRRRIAE